MQVECNCDTKTATCAEYAQALVESAQKWEEHKADPSIGYDHMKEAGKRLYRANEAHKKQEDLVRQAASKGQPKIERPWQLGPDLTRVRDTDRDSAGYKV